MLPTVLDEDSAHGFKRTLSALRGLRRSKLQSTNSLDELRRLLLLLVAMTEYRELLHQAAVDNFSVPFIVEQDVRLELRRKAAGPVPDNLRVTDQGALRVDLDTVTFTGSRHMYRVAAGHATSVHEDIGLGHVSVNPTGAQPWHLLGVSPVGVFAAASACRMTAEDSRRYRAAPAKLVADLLNPNDPNLLIPGDDPVLELEGFCRELAADSLR